MKTTRNFLIVLLGLAFVGSFLIQDNAHSNEMNQASLISLTDEINIGPGTETSVHPIDNSVVLRAVKDGENLIPQINLPEVLIEEKIDRNNVFPTIKVDGKYLPLMQLQEVKILAH